MVKNSLFYAVILGTLILSGCRTGRKATDGEGTKTVYVKINGLPESSKRPENLEFELSQCIQATSGQLVQDNLQFSSPEIKKGASCILKGKSLSPAADDDFLTETGVYFMAKDITIKEGSGGRLAATANIQTVYRKKVAGGPSIELTIPVQFDIKPQGQPVTATIDCNPGFIAAAKYNVKDDLNGSFVFSAAFSEAKKKFSCSEIHVVTNGGSQVFRATFSPVIAFETAPDLKLTAPLTKLSLVNTPTTEDVDPNIETVFCPDQEVYNETSQKCEPCPANQEFDSYTRTCVNKKPN